MTFNPEHYPKAYTEGFNVSDAAAVEAVQKYWLASDIEVSAIVIEETDRGTVVHAQTDSMLHQVNWAEPGLVPGDLEGYAQTVYVLAGPHEQQLKRAELLAKAVEAPQGVILYEDWAAGHEVAKVLSLGLSALRV